jgi:hypothetical protein
MSWRRFFHRASADKDCARELQSFLEIETEENIARGMSPEASRRAAYLKLGNPAAIREEVYEMNSIRFLETLVRDLRYAGRVLKATPTFTLVSLATLALGIGATTAIFTVVNGVILRPLPYRDPDRLVTAWETNSSLNFSGRPPDCFGFSPGNYLDLREQNRSFEQVGAFTTDSFNLTGGTVPDRVTGGLVSAGLLSALGVRPAIGRVLLRSDDAPGAEPVAVLSYRLWLERFGGNAGAIGKTIRLDDESHVIVGVMPASFGVFNQDVDVWMPLEPSFHPKTCTGASLTTSPSSGGSSPVWPWIALVRTLTAWSRASGANIPTIWVREARWSRCSKTRLRGHAVRYGFCSARWDSYC